MDSRNHIRVLCAGRQAKAQEKPEENKDIMVRVAGYSAYFVDLTTGMQNEIIQRTTNESIS